jgi:hypothetical protein
LPQVIDVKQTLKKIDQTYQKEFLELIAKGFSKVLQSRRPKFIVSGPCKMNYSFGYGDRKQFKTVNLIGEEQFISSTCYVGKSGKLILVGKMMNGPEGGNGNYEIDFEKANGLLTGFDKFYNAYLEAKEATLVTAAQQYGAEIEALEYVDVEVERKVNTFDMETTAKNDEWGSW